MVSVSFSRANMNSTSAADNLATIRLERFFLSGSWEIAIPNRTEDLSHRCALGRKGIGWAAPLINGAIIVTSPKNDYISRSSSICEGLNDGSFRPIDNVMGRIHINVAPSMPQSYIAIARGRQFKFKRLPVGIEYEVDEEIFACEVSTQRDAVRITAPVRFVEFHAMPAFARPCD